METSLKKWLRWISYSLFLLAFGIISTGRTMNTPDMENSIPQGSWLWFWGQDFQVGSVVLIENPLDSTQKRLLRILGAEGQTIRFHRDGFLIDGKRLHLTDMGDINSDVRRWKESYYHTNGSESSWLTQSPNQASSWSMEEITIPKGHIFVVCDNRHQCLDSRWWGTISEKLIVSTLKIQVSKPDPWHSILSFYTLQKIN
jgi:signal peptidase I